MANPPEKTESAAGSASYAAWFRNAAPYISTHRGRTFVVYVGDRAVAGQSFPGILQDVALLATVGIRVVLIYGTESLVDTALGRPPRGPAELGTAQVTDAQAMTSVLDVAGKLRFQIEARLSMALANVPLAQTPIRVTSGNYVHARPAGVRGGQDLLLTGDIRRVDADGISQSLDEGQVVLLPPIGYSPSGELFNLSGSDLAAHVAVELHAAKLIALDEKLRLRTDTASGLADLTLQSARDVLAQRRTETAGLDAAERILEQLANACRLGVRRGHLLDASVDGALILELFTRDGIGTMVAADIYDDTRQATSNDVGGIADLIAPLEHSQALVRRPRERLESEIDRFMVMERDGTIVACAAVYPVTNIGDGSAPEFVELACMAVHPAYRNSDRGDALLRRAEQEARSAGAAYLFVLTTQAEHWFLERGFERRDHDALPVERRQSYNAQRSSKVLIKSLRIPNDR